MDSVYEGKGMTGEEILAMEAGRELDKLVCERVMGGELFVGPVIVDGHDLGQKYDGVRWRDEYGDTVGVERVPDYSITWEGMRLVVESMQAKGWWLVLKSPFVLGEPYYAGFTPLGTSGWNGRPDFGASGDDAPHAVCLAALLALEATREQS